MMTGIKISRSMIIRVKLFVVGWALLLGLSSSAFAQQSADPHFNTSVAHPAFTKNFPRVLFDEAHNNGVTTTGRYKPFADLLFSDGYHLVVNRKPFAKLSLQTFKIIVIVNPLGAEETDDDGADQPAFTIEEAEAVYDWIRSGGSLLLIADPEPFASAAESFAKRLGIDMGKRPTRDVANYEKDSDIETWIVYSRENKLLTDHSITVGRNETEKTNRVIAFTGQSLKGPEGSVAFLKLGDKATDNPSTMTDKEVSAAGRAQGIAIKLGKGRIVVLGDAEMLSAQTSGREGSPIGMNYPDTDNKQLALNIMHWLSGLLPER